ncbi:VOC family protein [Sinomonas soli]
MSIIGVHHAGIIVKDLDESIYFYHDILGLPFVTEPSPWFSGEGLAKGVGVPGASLRQVCLGVAETQVELIEYGNREDDHNEAVHQNHLGAMHLALRVDDIAAEKARLEAAGVEFLSDVNTVDDGVLAGWRWVYLRDPDGITIELVEVAYERPKSEREAAYQHYLGSRPARSLA